MSSHPGLNHLSLLPHPALPPSCPTSPARIPTAPWRTPSRPSGTSRTTCSSRSLQKLQIEVWSPTESSSVLPIDIHSGRNLFSHQVQSPSHYRRIWRPLYPHWPPQPSFGKQRAFKRVDPADFVGRRRSRAPHAHYTRARDIDSKYESPRHRPRLR